MVLQGKDFWVFGYGSLLWNPGFVPVETIPARVTGFRRAFCMWSIHHRGSEDDPGLVLALDVDQTAICDGLAFRVAEDERAAVLDYLRERELISAAYREEICPLALQDGREIDALAYVIERDHVQYCGDLSLQRQAEVIAHAVGGRGPNTEYLYNTVGHLDELGIRDPDLDWLMGEVKRLSAARARRH